MTKTIYQLQKIFPEFQIPQFIVSLWPINIQWFSFKILLEWDRRYLQSRKQECYSCLFFNLWLTHLPEKFDTQEVKFKGNQSINENLSRQEIFESFC